MDMGSIDKAVASYRSVLGEDDLRRLGFFLPIWKVMAELDDELGISRIAYDMPLKETALDAYRENIPVLREAPATVGSSLLAKCASRLSKAFADSGAYGPDVSVELEGIDWDEAVAATDIGDAGSDPGEWLSQLAEVLSAPMAADEERHEGATKPGPDDVGSSTSAAMPIAMVAASLALRLFLEGPSKIVMSIIDSGKQPPHGLTCPVCGCPPILAKVGSADTSSGRGRMLACGQCGAHWEFERIRCASCGTREQQQLVYRHIGDDDAHRLHVCKKCGGATRTVFLEEAEAPYSQEVEDVVMAKLDALARSSEEPAAS